MEAKVTIIGGGLAGIEAAYQIAKRGIACEIVEMRPEVNTEAHTTPYLAEMVCSNSLGSNEWTSASGLLKEELRRLDSFFLRMAEKFRVPAGNSLSVDRLRLAEAITRETVSLPQVKVIRREAKDLPQSSAPVIIASGPLTSASLACAISEFTMRKNLFFFDATCPLIAADSIDFSRLFAGTRYNKGEADFLNIALDEVEYRQFVEQLCAAETVDMKEFEKDIFFEACLPIEELARRGEKSLSYGPLKPVGLVDPRTHKMPHAVIQLRQDDLNKAFYQLVGFQTRLKWNEQKRIFRTLPGLEHAEFERFGRMHRNTYLNAPLILNRFFQAQTNPALFFAGQISGVEGYVESVSSGLLAGLAVAATIRGQTLTPLPDETACGALLRHITGADWKDFTPTKFSFGLLPSEGFELKNKKKKKGLLAERALDAMSRWITKTGI